MPRGETPAPGRRARLLALTAGLLALSAGSAGAQDPAENSPVVADDPTVRGVGAPDDGPAGAGTATGWTSIDDPDVRGSLRPGSGIRLTPWLEVQPWARVGTSWESNVFRSSVEPRDDLIVEAGAGLDVQARSRYLRASAGYTISRRTYLEQSGLDSLDQRLRLELGMNQVGFVEDAYARGSLLFVTRPADPRLEGDGGVVDRTAASLATGITLRLERRFAVRGEGELVEEDYEPQDDDDRDLERFDHRGWTARGMLDLRPRRNISFLVGGEVRDLIYTNDQALAPDLRVIGVFAGGELRGRRLTAQLRLGWEEARILRVHGDPDPDAPSGPTILARVGWQLDRVTLITLDAQRRIDFSTSNSSQITTRVGVELIRSLTRTVVLDLRVGWEQRDPEEGNTIDVVRVGGGVGWRVLEWMTIGGDLGWDHWRRSADDEIDSFRVGAWVVVAP